MEKKRIITEILNMIKCSLDHRLDYTSYVLSSDSLVYR